MAYCVKCGKELLEGAAFCRHCGEEVPSVNAIHASGISTSSTNDDFPNFVGKNSEKYLRKFAKFSIGGVDRFRTTWHWPALFVPFFWLLYRKMYGWAVLALLTGWIPYVGWFLLPFIWAITANYIYYRHTKKKLVEIKKTYPSPEVQKALIAVRGGVGNAALLLGAAIILVGMIAVLAAIAIPQFAAFRGKAYNAQARSDIQNACNIATSILMADPRKVITLEDLQENGLKLSPGIELKIHDGTSGSLRMSAYHSRGSRVYAADNSCSITETVK